MLISLVGKLGAQKWTIIADKLPGKTSHYSDRAENNVEKGGITILTLTSKKKTGLNKKNGSYSFLIKLWVTDGPRLPNT